MSCLSSYTLRGVSHDCRANLAGVKRLYLAYWGDVIPQVDYATHTISGYTLAEGAEWFRYELARNSSSLNSVLTKDDASGTRYFTNTISVSFNKIDRAKHLEMMALAGEKLVAVVVTNDDTKWYVGLDGYLGASSQDAGTGTAAGDKNGYNLTLDCASSWLPFKFTADIDKPIPPIVTKYVQDLIDEGYATYVTGVGGTYISILSACPYSASQILDLQEVATNQKKLTGTTNNIIIWDQPKANGWTDNDIASLYNDVTLDFTPRARQFWALGDIDSFSVTYSGGTWKVNDYPWGSGANNNGTFAPRHNVHESYPVYFRRSPKNLTVNFTGTYSSIAQTMFAEMGSTTAFTLNGPGYYFSCFDWTGWFEDCRQLQNLTFNMLVRYDSTRYCHNMFRSCGRLISIPYVTSWGRDHSYNTIYPHNMQEGSANCQGMFYGCIALTSIGPTLNFAAVSLSGCTVDNIQQDALSDVMFECPELTDVRIKNIGWNSWKFTDSSTYTYIPKMDVASIEYLLNNVQDVTGNNYTLTFNTLHQGEISSSAISNATSKGWTIAYEEVGDA